MLAIAIMNVCAFLPGVAGLSGLDESSRVMESSDESASHCASAGLGVGVGGTEDVVRVPRGDDACPVRTGARKNGLGDEKAEDGPAAPPLCMAVVQE